MVCGSHAVARMALDMVDFVEHYVHKDGRRIKIRWVLADSVRRG